MFATVGDPVASGLVSSLARPGGNVTGLSIVNPDLIGKWMELIKQAVPGVSRVAVLWTSDAVTFKNQLKRAEAAGRALGLQVQSVEARDSADFGRAFSDMVRGRAGALIVVGGPVAFNARKHLADLTTRNRLPAVYGARDYVDAGGFMSYGPDNRDSFRRAAT